MKNRHARGFHAEAGAAIIELAVSLLMLVLLLLGTVDFARVFYADIELTNAARAGAQYGIACASIAAVRCKASTDQVQECVKSRALGMTVTVTMPEEPAISGSGTTVSVTFQTLFTPAVPFIPNTMLTLRSTAQMIMAR